MFNWLTNRFKKRGVSLDNPLTPLNSPWFGPPALAGVTVDEESCDHYSAFFAAVRAISTDVAGLCIQPFEHLPNGGKQVALDHWTYDLVVHTPDNLRTAKKFWAAIIGHCLRWGNGFAEIEWLGSGSARLHLLPPDRMQVVLEDNGRIRYDFLGSLDRPAKKIAPENIIHIANPVSYNGIVGKSIVATARESIGLGLATDLTLASWYGNSAKPGGVVKHAKGPVKANTKANAREYWDELYQGVFANGRVAHMWDGDEWIPTQLPAPDAAYLASRQFQISEMCRWFGCPPSILGDFSKSTYNLEQTNMDYVQRCLRPWVEFTCGELNIKLLDRNDRKRYFFAPDYHQLLKADTVSRGQYFAVCRNWGILSQNECRAIENRNSIGAQGDFYLSPANMVTGNQLVLQDQQLPPEPTQQPAPSVQAPNSNPIRQIILDELGRCLRRETKKLERAAKKPNFLPAAEDIIAETAAIMRSNLVSSVVAFNSLDPTHKIDLETLVNRWADRSRSDVQSVEAVSLANQLASNIEDMGTRWTNRPAETLDFVTNGNR